MSNEDLISFLIVAIMIFGGTAFVSWVVDSTKLQRMAHSNLIARRRRNR